MQGDPEQLYLDVFEQFAIRRDQLGDTLDNERQSNFAQHAECALLFFFGGIASAVVSRLGEAMADATLTRLKALKQHLSKSRQGDLDDLHQTCITAVPALVVGVKAMDSQSLQALKTALRDDLRSRGYSKATATELVDLAILRLIEESVDHE